MACAREGDGRTAGVLDRSWLHRFEINLRYRARRHRFPSGRVFALVVHADLNENAAVVWDELPSAEHGSVDSRLLRRRPILAAPVLVARIDALPSLARDRLIAEAKLPRSDYCQHH